MCSDHHIFSLGARRRGNVTFRTPTALELEAGVEHLKGGTGVQWEWVVSASAILAALAGLCKYLWYSTQPERE
jgi:hypothetical protein